MIHVFNLCNPSVSRAFAHAVLLGDVEAKLVEQHGKVHEQSNVGLSNTLGLQDQLKIHILQMSVARNVSRFSFRFMSWVVKHYIGDF
jgi:hypothetical protein